MPKNKLLKVVMFAVAAPAVVAAIGFLVMSLWNWLAPAVFDLRTITFWQALGLLILARILFGGLHGPSGDSKPGRRHLRDRWGQMTPEEREKLRQALRDRSVGSEAASGQPQPEMD